jgi:hypothetical protein
MLKNLNKSANSSTNQKHSKALLFGLYMFDQYKKPEQEKSHASVPLMQRGDTFDRGIDFLILRYSGLRLSDNEHKTSVQ